MHILRPNGMKTTHLCFVSILVPDLVSCAYFCYMHTRTAYSSFPTTLYFSLSGRIECGFVIKRH